MPKAGPGRFKNTTTKNRSPATLKESRRERNLIYPLAAVIIILSLIFILYTIFKVSRPPTEKEIRACRVDSDCIEVPADCCSCANGGKSTSINRNYKGYLAEKRASECRDFVCLTVYACDEEVKPRCVSGQCVLKSDKAPQ